MHIFRHLAQKLLDRRQPACVVSIQSDEKYDCAICTSDLISASLERRQKSNSRYSGVDIIASKLICGECGCFYSPKVWHSTDRYRRVVYQCGHKYKDGKRCSTPHFSADEIKLIFIQAVNDLIDNKDELIANLEEGIALVSDCTALETERDRMKEETALLADMVENCIRENARVAQNQTEYQTRYNSLVDQYEKAKARYGELKQHLEANHTRVQMMTTFVDSIRNQTPLT